MMEPVNAANCIRESVGHWLDEMGEGLPPGRFRFCKTRSLVPSSGRRGQGAVCFAIKSAWHVGAWQNWPSDVKEGCTQFIKSFQLPDGNFIDRWLLNRIEWSYRLTMAKNRRFRDMFSDMREHKTRTVRAETRQSAATLMLLGHHPLYPVPVEWRSENAVREFVQSLNWALPWGAGSHTSHLVAFAVMNGGATDGSMSKDEMLKAAFQESDRFLDEKTGAWGNGDVGHVQRLNGAMKMMTAYEWAERPIPYPDRLLDYALVEQSEDDGCGVLDRLFVVHQASKHAPGYRTEEVRSFALEALAEIDLYRQPDGGFSFHPTQAQRSYYGALVSLGGRQSDLHGTVMFTWACAIALDLLGIRQELGWQLSKA